MILLDDSPEWLEIPVVPAQEAADDTGEAELEWLENPVVSATEGHDTPQVQGVSGTLGPDAQPARVPLQLEVP